MDTDLGLLEVIGSYEMIVSPDGVQSIKSENYNCTFDYKSGYMERWGKGKECDDTPPVPEVVDVEVTTSCTGVNGVNCEFCYKSLNPNGLNMSFETFKEVFDKFPESVTQIAFSADSTLKSNPELFDMMKYCRTNDKNYVIPSISVAQLERPEAVKLLECGVGCVGVSLYADKDVCYDTAKLLTDISKEMGIPAQINLQVVVSEHNFEYIMSVLDDINEDPRLEDINCIVYLSLKQKGRGEGFALLSDEGWMELLAKTADKVELFGVDVCSTGKLQAFEGESEETKEVAEPCESGYYSMYINLKGDMFPCSFLEDTPGWETGISLVDNDFNTIWLGDRFKQHRKDIEAIRCGDCTGCPYWDI